MFGKKLFGVLVVFFVTFITAPVSWAGIVHEFTPDEEYLAFGAEFDSVVGLFGNRSDGTQQWLGSANVISNFEVAASAHQIGNFESYTIKSGNDLVNGVTSSYTSSSEVLIHPSWRGTSGFDQSIIKFDNQILSISAAKLYTGEHVIGSEYAIVGYGATGIPGGTQSVDGFKRGGINILSQIDESDVLGNRIGARFVDSNHPDFHPLGILGAPGDSGGAWLIDVDGEWQLAGIHSFSGPPQYGSNSRAPMLDLEWFNKNTSVSAVPEPNSFLIFSFGLLIVLVFSRKRMQT